jgi:hypothetical protein
MTMARQKRRVTRMVTAFTAAVLVTGAAACGGGSDGTTAPRVSYAGLYTLRQIARVAPPTKIYDGGATDDSTGTWYDQFVVTINSGTLDLDDQGHYHITFEYTLVHNGVSENRTQRAQGTYHVEGTQIVLIRDTGVDGAEGTVSAGAITVEMTLMRNTPTVPYTFQK